MAILEWFGIAFDADTGQANKKINDLSKTTDEFADKTNKAGLVSNKFGTSLVGLAARAAGVVGALFSIGAVMGGLSNSIAYADSIGETAEALGLATDELSAWSDAAKMTGGSAEGLQNSVRSLSKDFYQFAATGNSRTEPFFKKLGISMLDANKKARNILDVLPELAEKMEAMSKQDAIGLGQKLGLDQGTIMLLQQGRRGVEELVARQKELGTVSQEDAEVAAAFNDALDDTAHSFRTIYMGIATAILPAFTWFLQKIQAITNFVKKHAPFFKMVFMGISTALTMYYIPVMYKAAKATMLANKALLTMLAPIALVTLAIALLYDEIVTYLEGGESYFGDFVKFLRQNFGWLIDGFSKVIEFFVDAWNDPEKAIDDFKLFLKTVWNDFIDSIPGLRTVLDTVVKIFDTAIGAIKATIEAVTKTIDNVSNKWDSVKRAITPESAAEKKARADFGEQTQAYTPEQQARWNAQQKLQQAQQLTPVVASMGQAVNNNALSNSNRNSTVNATINISGSDLSKTELKETIKDTVNDLARTASSQIDDGESH